MEEEMQYAKDLKENFLKIRNSQYTGDEYYYVIMGILQLKIYILIH